MWGVLISLASTLFALFFVYRISERLYDARAARVATLCLAFFPTAFFMNAVYTEALFLALTTGAFWAARVKRSFLLAGLLGALAAATRNVGVLLVLPLLWEWARCRREVGWRGLLCVALVPAGTVAYALYLRSRFGDPLVFARQQGEYWNREPAGPLETLGEAWEAARDGMAYVLDPAALFLGTDATPALEASYVLHLAFLPTGGDGGNLARVVFAAVLLRDLLVERERQVEQVVGGDLLVDADQIGIVVLDRRQMAPAQAGRQRPHQAVEDDFEHRQTLVGHERAVDDRLHARGAVAPGAARVQLLLTALLLAIADRQQVDGFPGRTEVRLEPLQRCHGQRDAERRAGAGGDRMGADRDQQRDADGAEEGPVARELVRVEAPVGEGQAHPGAALAVAVLGFNLAGEALRDRLDRHFRERVRRGA